MESVIQISSRGNEQVYEFDEINNQWWRRYKSGIRTRANKKTCSCGKEFLTDIKEKNDYCSIKCSKKHTVALLDENITEKYGNFAFDGKEWWYIEDWRRSRAETTECKCGNIFPRRKNLTNPQRYCSKECAGKYGKPGDLFRSWTGDKNPSYSHGRYSKRIFSEEEMFDIQARYHNEQTTTYIAKLYNTTTKNIREVLIDNGIIINKKSRKISAKREDGYRLIRIYNNDPYFSMAHKHIGGDENGSYVMEHRLVMARHLKRPLEDYESVHHINGIKHQNNIENLQLRIGNHGSGCAYICMDCGSQNIKPTPLAENDGTSN